MIIELLNGTRYDIDDYNLKRLFHRIPSAQISHTLSSVEGRSDIITSSKLNNRTISVELLYESYDIYDYYLLRDELNALFTRKEPFYIMFKREPYKRWKVRLASQFDTEPHPYMQSFVVDFVTENVCAESVQTTLELLKEWDANQHAWNNTITWDDDIQYSFATNNFVVKNLGNEIIDPCEHELEIILKGNFASNVKITNHTTGDIYQYKRTLSSTDELKIIGVRTFRNGASDFKNTNYQLLTLAPGINNISVEGGTLTSIAFNFRFLFK